MPRSTREWARRKLDEAVLHINYMGTHLNQVKNVYEGPHPEIGNALEAAMSAMEEVETLIKRVRCSI